MTCCGGPEGAAVRAPYQLNPKPNAAVHVHAAAVTMAESNDQLRED